MFKRRTLFVVGAGASVEVGMPVGIDLAKRIAGLLDFKAAEPGPNQGDGDMIFLGQFHRRFGAAIDAYRRAGWAIRDGVRLTHSIDDFLDMHIGNEMIQRMGKAAIAQTILNAETDSGLFFNPYSYQETFNNIEATWYMKFFRMLGRGINLGNAKEIFDPVSFIIFNYDRCIEHFLINALSLVYTISLEDAASIVSDLNIIHPYGTVGDLPLLPGSNPVSYGPLRSETKLDYTILAERIKTYTEQIGGADETKAIHNEMRRAECIVFLGFGYHEQNLALLNPGEELKSIPIFGTAHGFSGHNCEVVQQKIERMFQRPPPKVVPRSPVVIDRGVTCAGLFDNYAQSLTSGK
jgi:hypothetical protein